MVSLSLSLYLSLSLSLSLNVLLPTNSPFTQVSFFQSSSFEKISINWCSCIFKSQSRTHNQRKVSVPFIQSITCEICIPPSFKYWFGLIHLFKNISTSVGYLRQRHSCRRSVVVYLSRGLRKKGIIPFPCLKVNVIAQMEFELVYYEVAVHHVSRNATGTPSF